jgi:diaminopimelate decarboxylase
MQQQTPFYQYDLGLLRATLAACVSASQEYSVFPHDAIKANNQPEILREISGAGLGADCVSINEVKMALRQGFNARDIVFSGSGKRVDELREAITLDIGCLNIESIPELHIASRLAADLGIRTPISLRITPETEIDTHAYLTTGRTFNKFGILEEELRQALAFLSNDAFLHLHGLHVHAGSQILDLSVFADLAQAMNRFNGICRAAGFSPRMLNLGGGLGVDYHHPDAAPFADFIGWFSAIRSTLRPFPGQTVHVEPGRSLVAQCGSLITSVLYIKPRGERTFAICDAGMTELIRPALYGSYHQVEPYLRNASSGNTCQYDIVGPICESSDTFATGLQLPELQHGDMLCIRSAGAYGQCMSSGYNMRESAWAVFVNMGEKLPWPAFQVQEEVFNGR